MPTKHKVIDKLFLQHPAAGGETYKQHLFFAVKTGWCLLVSAVALIFHGVVPKFCQNTASDRIIRLADTLRERRKKCDEQ